MNFLFVSVFVYFFWIFCVFLFCFYLEIFAFTCSIQNVIVCSMLAFTSLFLYAVFTIKIIIILSKCLSHAFMSSIIYVQCVWHTLRCVCFIHGEIVTAFFLHFIVWFLAYCFSNVICIRLTRTNTIRHTHKYLCKNNKLRQKQTRKKLENNNFSLFSVKTLEIDVK